MIARSFTSSSTLIELAATITSPARLSVLSGSPITARVLRSTLLTATATPTPTLPPLATPPAHVTLVPTEPANIDTLRPVICAALLICAKLSLVCWLYMMVPATANLPPEAPDCARLMSNTASSAFMLKPPSAPLNIFAPAPTVAWLRPSTIWMKIEPPTPPFLPSEPNGLILNFGSILVRSTDGVSNEKLPVMLTNCW